VNPSRISTPVKKEIDEWHFRFNQRIVKFHVLIERCRDAQKSEDNPKPWIKFTETIDTLELDRAGIKKDEFAPVTFSDEDIHKLRERCQAHVQAMLKLDWKRVIVVGFKPEAEKDILMERERRDPAIQLQFDYAVGERAGEFFRREDDDDSSYFLKEAPNLLNGYSWDKETDVHVFDYDEQLLATLKLLKDRYAELNRRVADLVKPGKLEQLTAALNRMLPAPPKEEPCPQSTSLSATSS
jgi:hypothetical protein